MATRKNPKQLKQESTCTDLILARDAGRFYVTVGTKPRKEGTPKSLKVVYFDLNLSRQAHARIAKLYHDHTAWVVASPNVERYEAEIKAAVR